MQIQLLQRKVILSDKSQFPLKYTRMLLKKKTVCQQKLEKDVWIHMASFCACMRPSFVCVQISSLVLFTLGIIVSFQLQIIIDRLWWTDRDFLFEMAVYFLNLKESPLYICLYTEVEA